MASLGLGDAWGRLARARSATLATIRPGGAPHLVPCCFALDGLTLYSAVDDKPKTTARLQRLENLEADARASVLADRYDERWDRLWWVRASGDGRLVTEAAERDAALLLLVAKYPQYEAHQLDGPVLAITLRWWRAWAASES